MNRRLIGGGIAALVVIAMVVAVVVVVATGDDDSPSAVVNASPTVTAAAGTTAAGPVWLGISGEPATDGNGVTITNVSGGGPADAAGLENNDVILSIDGTAVNDVQALASAVTSHKAGDEVTLSVIKSGATSPSASPTDVTVTLQARPTTPTPVPQVSPAPGQPYLGISGGPVADGEGVAISSVAVGSPADKAGLKEGDVIVEADGTAVNNIPALAAIVTAKQAGDKITLTVVKDGITHPDGDKTAVDVKLAVRPEDTGAATGKAYIGISGTTGPNGGVDVTDVVDGGPADNAGIAAGDHIIGVDGEAVEGIEVLAGTIAVHNAEDKVTLSVVKDGAAHPDGTKTDVVVTLEERPVSGQ